MPSAFVSVRPPGHHATCGVPSGFCWLNNVVCGAVYAAAAHNVRHVAIVDIDLHHGDGTQAIVRQLSLPADDEPGPGPGPAGDDAPGKKAVQAPRLFYGSLHDILSYPCEVYDRDKVTPGEEEGQGVVGSGREEDGRGWA